MSSSEEEVTAIADLVCFIMDSFHAPIADIYVTDRFRKAPPVLGLMIQRE